MTVFTIAMRRSQRQHVMHWSRGVSYTHLDVYKRQHLEKHGFKHIRFHDLRHSCASALLADRESTVGLKDIQSWLGHSDLKSTMRYAHIVEVKTKMHTAESINSLIFPQK